MKLDICSMLCSLAHSSNVNNRLLSRQAKATWITASNLQPYIFDHYINLSTTHLAA
jgi:hypothetical protein